MRAAPRRVLVSNPPYSQATASIEHAFAIGFETVIFLLSTSYLHTADRRERIHKRGCLARVHVLDLRLQDMHDEAHIRAGGKTASQSWQTHSWFVFDLRHFGPATLHSASLHHPDELMPWEELHAAPGPTELTKSMASSVSRLSSTPPTSGRVSTGLPGPPETISALRAAARAFCRGMSDRAAAAFLRTRLCAVGREPFWRDRLCDRRLIGSRAASKRDCGRFSWRSMPCPRLALSAAFYP